MVFKKTIQKVIPLALGVFLVWLMFSKLSINDFNDIKTSFKTANYWWIALSLLFGVLSHFSRAYRWLYMLQPLGYHPRFLNSFMAVLITYLVNLGIPRAGEISRAIVMAKYEKIPFQKGFGTIVAERVADLLILLLLILLALWAQYDFIAALLAPKMPDNPAEIFLALSILAVIFMFFLRLIRISNKPIFVKTRIFLDGIFQGVKSISKMKKKWSYFMHTIFIWTMYILMFYVATFALPETTGLSINAALVCFVVGALSFTVTNGGIGAYPWGIKQVLILYAIAENPAFSFGWILWSSQTLLVIVFGSLSFILFPIYNKNYQANIPNNVY